MKRRRVKITGIGPVTPAGIGREEFWKGILEPISRVRPFDRLDESAGPFVAAFLDRFNVGKYIDKQAIPKGAARHTLIAIAGSVLACEDAKIKPKELCQARVAVVTGSSVMDFGGILGSVDNAVKRGPSYAQARVIFTAGIGSIPSAIGQALGLSVQSIAISNHCTSGLDAIGYAAGLIENGLVDIAICGGAEAPLHRFPMLELRAAEMTPATRERSEAVARPFDMWRTTGVVAEGCCMFVLESDASPRPGYSIISGYAFCSDDEVTGVCGGLYDSGKLAMANAGASPSDVEVINAWGPGHKAVDAGEASAMCRLFGQGLSGKAAVSIKGAIGSPLGAAGAIQLASAALSQRNSVVPPTVNWFFPDPACPLELSRCPRVIRHQMTLINAHGLGSINSSMIIERC